MFVIIKREVLSVIKVFSLFIFGYTTNLTVTGRMLQFNIIKKLGERVMRLKGYKLIILSPSNLLTH